MGAWADVSTNCFESEPSWLHGIPCLGTFLWDSPGRQVRSPPLLSRRECVPICTHIPPTSVHTLHLDPKQPCGGGRGRWREREIGVGQTGSVHSGLLSSQPQSYPLASKDPQSSETRGHSEAGNSGRRKRQ